MNRENTIKRFRPLVLLQGDGSDVYEIIKGDLFPRARIGTCKGDDIIATFEAWDDTKERLTVIKGEKCLFWDDNKAFFHMFQVGEEEHHGEEEFCPLYTKHDFY